MSTALGRPRLRQSHMPQSKTRPRLCDARAMLPRVALLLVASGLFAVACGGEPSKTLTSESTGPTPAHVEGECLTASDCHAGESCFAPDFYPTGVTPCTDDYCRDYRGGMVCSGGECVPPCTDTSCGPGYSCRPPQNPKWPKRRLCEPRPCNAPGAIACADKFTCNPTSGVCDRMSCNTAADCGAEPRACWNGQCFDHGGSCHPGNFCCPP